MRDDSSVHGDAYVHCNLYVHGNSYVHGIISAIRQSLSRSAHTRDTVVPPGLDEATDEWQRERNFT
ncbi:hypothetical protein SBD_6788 [Streptomyces bottropensis ATCC 25435]|uniref:Uncharacterized protein n=1 Tax=Streptomyces bottropensis ATCC 25435 TaxID=1054862 RepID=M3E817_9ACTN|nr:hypothetical protein SBD_6788 [Streptomyces bottropensis ATCC 25435]